MLPHGAASPLLPMQRLVLRTDGVFTSPPRKLETQAQNASSCSDFEKGANSHSSVVAAAVVAQQKRLDSAGASSFQPSHLPPQIRQIAHKELSLSKLNNKDARKLSLPFQNRLISRLPIKHHSQNPSYLLQFYKRSQQQRAAVEFTSTATQLLPRPSNASQMTQTQRRLRSPKSQSPSVLSGTILQQSDQQYKTPNLTQRDQSISPQKERSQSSMEVAHSSCHDTSLLLSTDINGGGQSIAQKKLNNPLFNITFKGKKIHNYSVDMANRKKTLVEYGQSTAQGNSIASPSLDSSINGSSNNTTSTLNEKKLKKLTVVAINTARIKLGNIIRFPVNYIKKQHDQSFQENMNNTPSLQQTKQEVELDVSPFKHSSLVLRNKCEAKMRENAKRFPFRNKAIMQKVLSPAVACTFYSNLSEMLRLQEKDQLQKNGEKNNKSLKNRRIIVLDKSAYGQAQTERGFSVLRESQTSSRHQIWCYNEGGGAATDYSEAVSRASSSVMRNAATSRQQKNFEDSEDWCYPCNRNSPQRQQWQLHLGRRGTSRLRREIALQQDCGEESFIEREEPPMIGLQSFRDKIINDSRIEDEICLKKYQIQGLQNSRLLQRQAL